MTDVHTEAQRRRNMSAVRSKDTHPEMLIRRGLHARGFRYSLHHRKLPGHPDLVLRKYNAVVFIHGCFWHGHDCPLFRWPASRADFWRAKIGRNREVDARSALTLTSGGWRILTIWECALKGPDRRPIEDVLEQAGNWLVSGEATAEIRGAGGAGAANPGSPHIR
jgi:DNA mismatch endonuclease (patch repair protein)